MGHLACLVFLALEVGYRMVEGLAVGSLAAEYPVVGCRMTEDLVVAYFVVVCLVVEYLVEGCLVDPLDKVVVLVVEHSSEALH